MAEEQYKGRTLPGKKSDPERVSAAEIPIEKMMEGHVPELSPADLVAQQMAAMQEQMKQIVGIVSTQQKTFHQMQEQGLRVSDAMAAMDSRLTLEAHMGPHGWEVELEGPWTMGNVNQLRLVLRGELQQMATRQQQWQAKESLEHRGGAVLPKFSAGD